MKIKRISAAIATVIAVGITILTPTAAHAAGRDGVCNSGEFCLYYNSDFEGSVSDFTGSIPDYGDDQPSCYEFKGDGNGKGRCVKNDAASVWNRTSKPVTVYFHHDYAGRTQVFASGAKANLSAKMKNENASHKFNTSDNNDDNETLSHGLYNASGGSITCGFDGYVNTDGRHEGIDIARSVGSNIYALVPGEITYIARGSNGSGGLSTIAIYNESLNKTVIYLHSDPLDSLFVGQNIKRDQRIGDEAWHGVSSSGAAHTHVEMRLGRQTHAAVSVGDPDLTNPNPTAFWHDRGYDIS